MLNTPAAPRALRRLAAAALLVATFAGGIAVGIARAADQNLDDALNALQKASALLEASQAGVADPKIVRRFERRVERALRYIDRAAETIESAKQVVDG
jgi:hypothetical protein